MIDQLISKYDELPALSTAMRLLFFHRGIGGAPESALTENIERLRTAFREVEQTRLYKAGPVMILPHHLSSVGTNGYRKHHPRLVELAALAEDAIGNKTLA
jgi:hypothetical protein